MFKVFLSLLLGGRGGEASGSASTVGGVAEECSV